jgi:hypothetical protein
LTTSNQDELPTLTLSSLIETVREIKAKYPFAGMEVVESPFIPEGITLLKSEDKIAILNEEKAILIPLPKDLIHWR